MKKNRAAKIGSYVVSIMFLSMALFFVFLLLKNQNADQGRMVKIVIGALTFFGLFIAVLKSVSKTKREKIVFWLDLFTFYGEIICSYPTL
jgi:hypothetical protein